MAINPGRRWRSIDELRRGLYSPTEPEVGPDRLPELVARRGGRVQFEELMELMRPAFSQLRRLHATGRLHLGVRPDSLQLRSDGLRLDAPPKDIPAPSGGYAAPELYDSGKEPDARADIYALAGCLYYGLTGVTPPRAPGAARQGASGARELRRGHTGKEPGGAASRSLARYLRAPGERRGLRLGPRAGRRGAGADIRRARDTRAGAARAGIRRERAFQARAASGQGRAGSSMIALAAVLAAMALILAIALIPRDESGPEPPAIVTGRPESLPDFDELFADAVTVADAAELAAALEDEAVPAIICSGEVTNEPGAAQLRLTKPVYVPEDGVLDAADGALVAARGLHALGGRLRLLRQEQQLRLARHRRRRYNLRRERQHRRDALVYAGTFHPARREREHPGRTHPAQRGRLRVRGRGHGLRGLTRRGERSHGHGHHGGRAHRRERAAERLKARLSDGKRLLGPARGLLRGGRGRLRASVHRRAYKQRQRHLQPLVRRLRAQPRRDRARPGRLGRGAGRLRREGFEPSAA